MKKLAILWVVLASFLLIGVLWGCDDDDDNDTSGNTDVDSDSDGDADSDADADSDTDTAATAAPAIPAGHATTGCLSCHGKGGVKPNPNDATHKNAKAPGDCLGCHKKS